jgi:hypothetical protein
MIETDPWLAPLRANARFRSLTADLARQREIHLRLYRELNATSG